MWLREDIIESLTSKEDSILLELLERFSNIFPGLVKKALDNVIQERHIGINTKEYTLALCLYQLCIIHLQNTGSSFSQWKCVSEDEDTWRFYTIDSGCNWDKNIISIFLSELYSLIMQYSNKDILEQFNKAIENTNNYTKDTYKISFIFNDISEVPERINPNEDDLFYRPEEQIQNLNLKPKWESLRPYISSPQISNNILSFHISPGKNISSEKMEFDLTKFDYKTYQWAIVFYCVVKKTHDNFGDYYGEFNKLYQPEKKRVIENSTFVKDTKSYWNNFIKTNLHLEYRIFKNNNNYWDIIKY